MLDEIKATDLFKDYYAQWVRIYKEGAIRDVTLAKYKMAQSWLEKLVPTLKLCEVTRINYQQMLNDYALYHERQTTMDFHHQLKGAILDAVDEGLIERDPTRKVIIKGKAPANKKIKYLNQFELHALLTNLQLGSEASWDYFIFWWQKPECAFQKRWRLPPEILISHIRHCPSAKHGITKAEAVLHLQRISPLSGKSRLTGRQ